MKRPFSTVIVTLLLLVSCGRSEQVQNESIQTDADSRGTLTFVANGEDFVRNGFVAKDGWRIHFAHAYVTLAEVNAYQTSPPYEAANGAMPEGLSTALDKPITVDLAAGDATATSIVLETVDAPVGQYNALSWRMIPASGGAASGATISLVGTAEKSGAIVNFTVNDTSEYAYSCGEYVGDERKGILTAKNPAEVEATFHFDHIFGDAGAPMDGALNVGAMGFDPLATLAQNGNLESTVSSLEAQLDAETYTALVNALATLGHVGEGHCYEATSGYTGHSE